MRKIFVAVLLGMLWSASGAQSLFEEALTTADTSGAGNFKLGGFVKSSAYLGRYADANSIHTKSIYGQFGLSGEVKTGKFGSAYGEMRFRSGNEYGENFNTFELREAYVDLYLGPIDLRAGKQILSWGASSFMHPSDQFSPQNPGYRSPDADDLRIGVWALSSNLSITQNSKVQLLWMPVYTPSVLLTDPFEFPDYIEFGNDVSPGLELKESSFGLKYDLRSPFLDLELSYYNGYRNNPSIQLDSSVFNPVTLRPDLIRLSKAPYRIQNSGINITLPLGSYLFRCEAAWMKVKDDSLQGLPFSELSYAAEIEQSGQNITFIVGYWGKYNIDFLSSSTTLPGLTDEFPDVASLFPPGTPPDPAMINVATAEQIGGFNRLYNYQEEEFYHAAYASANISMFYTLLELELPVMYNFTSGELTAMPSLKFNIADGLSFRVGAYYLYGKENTLYELVGPVLNAGYGQLQYKF